MICPKCQSPITESFDPNSIVTCPGCGARLMTRAAALRSQGGKSRRPNPPPDPDLTPPVTIAPAAPMPMDLDAEGPSTTVAAEAPAATSPPEGEGPPFPAPPPPAAASGGPAGGPPTLDAVLLELQALRATQDQILALLRAGDGAAPEPPPEQGGAESPSLSKVRSRRRKTVLLIDDDPETREAALAELEKADVPVRVAADGNAALAAIAEEKPDVIALEVALPGEMAGKDLINMIKATMEWVDIPVVLWTREPVATQKEAREQHGADEIVNKSGGPAALVTRVITVFRTR